MKSVLLGVFLLACLVWAIMFYFDNLEGMLISNTVIVILSLVLSRQEGKDTTEQIDLDCEAKNE